jgi:hypothetical protein
MQKGTNKGEKGPWEVRGKYFCFFVEEKISILKKGGGNKVFKAMYGPLPPSGGSK